MKGINWFLVLSCCCAVLLGQSGGLDDQSGSLNERIQQ